MQNHLLLNVRILGITLAVILIASSNAHTSGAFPLNNPHEFLIGFSNAYIIKDNDTLIEIAREYGVGYNEIVAANNKIDPWVPEKGSRIIIPTAWLLPEILDSGIVINLAEMRLFYFYTANEHKYVSTYPVGIGRQGSHTPLGTFTVTAKVKDPVWHVPESIRKEDPLLPEFVSPGPDNPLGEYWLQLSVDGYGIHGTNRPYGIGRMVSHGCIRLYPEDIRVLFKLIKPGTMVKIINEPVKAGIHNNKVYLEVHPSERKGSELMMLAIKKLSRKRLLKHVDTQLIIQTVNNATGLPAVISR